MAKDRRLPPLGLVSLDTVEQCRKLATHIQSQSELQQPTPKTLTCGAALSCLSVSRPNVGRTVRCRAEGYAGVEGEEQRNKDRRKEGRKEGRKAADTGYEAAGNSAVDSRGWLHGYRVTYDAEGGASGTKVG